MGRARASEDIDVLIPRISFSEFLTIYDDLQKTDFYCLNTDDSKEMYEYLSENLAIRFAKKDTIIPNMELKFTKTKFDEIAL